MDIKKVIQVVDVLIAEANEEINLLQSQVTRLVIEQVALYAHDNIEGFPMTFGELGTSASLNKDLADEIQADSAELDAIILDYEQRRNALLHLKTLLEAGNKQAIETLEGQLTKWMNDSPPFDAIISPDEEHPSGHLKPYPYQ